MIGLGEADQGEEMEPQTSFEGLPPLKTILEIRTKDTKASMSQSTLTCANASCQDATSPQRTESAPIESPSPECSENEVQNYILTPSFTPLNTRSFTPINNHDEYALLPYIESRPPIKRRRELQIDILSHKLNGKIPLVYDDVPLWERILLNEGESQSNFDAGNIAEDIAESEDAHGSKQTGVQDWREEVISHDSNDSSSVKRFDNEPSDLSDHKSEDQDPCQQPSSAESSNGQDGTETVKPNNSSSTLTAPDTTQEEPPKRRTRIFFPAELKMSALAALTEISTAPSLDDCDAVAQAFRVRGADVFHRRHLWLWYKRSVEKGTSDRRPARARAQTAQYHSHKG